MVSRGSMCVSELYGKNMRIKVVQTLIEKIRKEDQIQKLKEKLKRNGTLSQTGSSPTLSPVNHEQF